MISARALLQFITVAEELHFGRAAKRLHMSQPPLSQAVMRLESTLEVKLFHRSKIAIELTEAGRVFLHDAREMLEQQARAIAHARQADAGVSGTVVLGFVGSVSYGLLPEVLARFRVEYPDLRFDLRELPSSEQAQELQARRIEIGVVRLPVANASGCEMRVIRRERMIAVLPASHPLCKRKTVALKDLADEAFMMFPPERVPSLHAKTLEACRAAGFSPRVALEAWQMPTMVSLVAAGVGVALLPEQIKNIPHRGVVYRDISDRFDSLELEIALAWRKDLRSRLCHLVIDRIGTMSSPGSAGRRAAREQR